MIYDFKSRLWVIGDLKVTDSKSWMIVLIGLYPGMGDDTINYD